MRFTLICLAISALAILPAVAQDVPELVNYQGLLTDAGGVPLATGTCDLSFSLYADADGNTRVWGPETHADAQVIDGQFNVILGSTEPLGDAFQESERYLGVAVSPEAEITPRQRILSTPYALSARNGVPIGTVNMWWGDVADIPDGWELCDGSTVQTVGSPIYGEAKPNLLDRVPRGAPSGDTVRGQLGTSGSDTVTLGVANLPNHSHTVWDAFMLEWNEWLEDHWAEAPPDGFESGSGGDFAWEWNTATNNLHGHLPGNSGVDYTNNSYICRRKTTHETGGAMSQPFSVVPSHQELFFIIRVL
ncbi:hypothetical protein JXA47_13855 [Candidatus Sumerlaeota bacterium]|nr:hypothetical protein [Candidatus Sumerlaeota bacterium]